mgnify:CR=1 FL=1
MHHLFHFLIFFSLKIFFNKVKIFYNSFIFFIFFNYWSYVT